MAKQKRKINRPIAVIDLETDPFKYGRIPRPFCAGFYSLDKGFINFWGNDCIENLVSFLESLNEPHTIYAHNGGKFDYHYFLKYIGNPIKIIGSRIAKATIGQHEIRDSYSIIPIPLATYVKDSIDYEHFEIDKREKYKKEIIAYLKTDCVALFDIVSKFIERFGKKLTIGGTAIEQLKKMHPFDRTYANHDSTFRQFYFGGRVENYGLGIFKGDFKVYDVNSMYPHVMRECAHPTGLKYVSTTNKIIDKNGEIAGFKGAKFYFAHITCEQRGAFPVRVKGEALNYDISSGEFFVTSHELKAAIKTGRAWKIKILKAYFPQETINFKNYVDTYMEEKIFYKKKFNESVELSEKNAAKAGEIFSKLLLNAAYGKFGQSSENYYDYWIGEPPNKSWQLYNASMHSIEIYRKPSETETFYDVATAASITSAARAVLMLALADCDRPMYCDTDSIICENLKSELHETKLGAWKLEATGDTLALCGKKLYALKSGREHVKTASKGVVMSGGEIFSLAKGKSFTWENSAPSFTLGKNVVSFTQRKILAKTL
jgi:hypothetical protein